MKYRPHRELLSESLAAQIEITTWEELVNLVANKSWHKNPVQISWKYEGYDDRCDWEDWNILIKEPQYSCPQYAGCTNEDPMKLIGCPGILPEATEYTPYPCSEKQKYQKGDRVRIHTVGHPLWEGGQVYDMAPQKVGKLATVIGSYYDQFGGSDDKPSYTLKFDDGGQSSWYNEYQMEPESTIEPCIERVQSAENSPMIKEIGKRLEDRAISKIVQDIEDQLVWGKPNKS